MFVEQEVYLYHVVHGFEQRLREVVIFQEEGVIAVLQIILEVLPRMHAGQDKAQNSLMIGQQLVERVCLEVLMRHEIDILSEREAV